MKVSFPQLLATALYLSLGFFVHQAFNSILARRGYTYLLGTMKTADKYYLYFSHLFGLLFILGYSEMWEPALVYSVIVAALWSLSEIAMALHRDSVLADQDHQDLTNPAEQVILFLFLFTILWIEMFLWSVKIALAFWEWKKGGKNARFLVYPKGSEPNPPEKKDQGDGGNA